MGRCLKPVCKISRRIGFDLSLKSSVSRNISTKCKLKVFPGQHGNKKKKVDGNYLLQLNAKQMVKFKYRLLEKQFKNFYKKVNKKKGVPGEFLLQLLESRLDNVVYRLGFALTRTEARQLVSHKLIVVKRKNLEKVISIPSFIVKENDIVFIHKKAKKHTRIKYALKCAEKIGFVKWIDVDIKDMSAIFLRKPKRSELSKEINEQLVIEFYSK